jgi:hypothetical protein
MKQPTKKQVQEAQGKAPASGRGIEAAIQEKKLGLPKDPQRQAHIIPPGATITKSKRK